MRLDKFIGRASSHLTIYVQKKYSNEELFYLPYGKNYSELKKEMKKYKVIFYTIRNNALWIDVKERKND